ncbi:hypothetical protein M8756_09645 [Lutimaribacter sp. EGI FJ00015]|uniref:Uncharacterized protein n=1 Tax=Lutimaribacter degradans TaxID=2945989 RepID=A0ACC5ZVT8_9RHOB|nr:hypothetical protein [Lutimaribacter sp. EGI FJ00013]MCM2562412.1 hypothetical protein [Lutimaribacter sp. EGI FJ00013]MCO0613569.1 hypothetical protein [Lutimaribacter sp. EGI FJ00015]MCO0636541.1 hypothetical protein [Lutimaribacter sp. EGI FJ00014]
MAQVIQLASHPRPPSGAAARAALVDAVRHHRRDDGDVFWLKENAELLNVMETTGQGEPDLLAGYQDIYDGLAERLRFFPQYYRFLLSIALDLEDMGLPGDVGTRMAQYVARQGLAGAELSDLQRAEARRLLARRDLAAPDPGLEGRLHAFANRADTFALPNRKAAYELTHIVFYLSDYGRRAPGLGPEALTSLRYAGLVALLEHNADLLAEICIALRFAGEGAPHEWLAWLRARLRAARVVQGAQALLPDSYHDWLMVRWVLALEGQDLCTTGLGQGRLSFQMPQPDGPLRRLSETLLRMGGNRAPDWAQMRPAIWPTLSDDQQATMALAESAPWFEPFFARFARA